MRDSFKGWWVRGVLVSAVWSLAACSALPQQAGNDTFRPGFVRGPDMPLYNGTIQDIPSSIDPRTAETLGTQNRSLRMDLGEQALFVQQLSGEGMGGSGLEFNPREPVFYSTFSNQAPASMSLPLREPPPNAGRPGAPRGGVLLR